MKSYRLLFLLMSWLSSVSCSDTLGQQGLHGLHDERGFQAGIVGGAQVDTQRSGLAPRVARLRIRVGGEYLTCTATFLSESLVITAAHCLEEVLRQRNGSREPLSPSVLRGIELKAIESNGAKGPAKEIKYSVIDVKIHPSYVRQPEKNFNQAYFDIALLRVEPPQQGPESLLSSQFVSSLFQPSRRQTRLLRDRSLLSRHQVLDSFGAGVSVVKQNESSGGFEFSGDGPLRRKRFIVRSRQDIASRTGLIVMKDMIAVEPAKSDSPGSHCVGDSGGPSFLIRDNEVFLAGITSYTHVKNLCYGPTALTSIPEYAGWVDRTAQRWGLVSP